MHTTRPSRVTARRCAAAALAAYAAAAYAAAACASGAAATGATSTVALPQTGAHSDVRVSSDLIEAMNVGASVTRVWAELPAVYQALQIPVNTLQPATLTIGNTAANFTRRLGDEQLSRFVTCGTRGFGSEIANEGGGVTLSILTTAVVAGDSTALRTVVQGTARMTGASGGSTRCTTTGRLEARIAELTRQRVATPR